MDVNHIDWKLIEHALQARRKWEALPPELLNLHFLQLLADSAANWGLSEALYRFFEEQARAALARYRQAEGIKPDVVPSESKEAIKERLHADFMKQVGELQAWSALYSRYFEPAYDIDISELAAAVNVHERTFRRYLIDGLQRLAAITRETEQKAHQQFTSLQLHTQLPPPESSNPIGIRSLVEQVSHLLSQLPAGVRFISLEGLGGIGKTTIAHEVAARLAQADLFTGMIWISARQEAIDEYGHLDDALNPAQSMEDIVAQLIRKLGYEQIANMPSLDEKLSKLAMVFSANSYLVVLDNLETAREANTLVPKLYPLTEGKSRFLLTSRDSLCQFSYVRSIEIPQLSLLDSKTLFESVMIRHSRALEERNTRLSPSEIESIYSVIGGVPLALKLTAAQVAEYPLEDTLKGLQEARYQGQENMFTYIYKRAWQLLSKPAQELLLFMAKLPLEGENIEWIRFMSGLPENQLPEALMQLRDRSLLEIAGTPGKPLYRLHRLTITFLQTTILQDWNVHHLDN